MKAALRMATLLCVFASACAGELDDPERFEFLLGDGGSALGDAAAGGSGAGDSGGPDAEATGGTGGGVDAGTAPACVTAIFEASCGSSVCHDASAAQVDLISDGVASRLVGVPAPAGSLCEGRVYVATDGTASLLLDKLGDTPPCGSKMPLVGNDLTTTQIECLSAWVTSLGGGS